jgi:type III secretion system YscQ/HrcQ family protein
VGAFPSDRWPKSTHAEARAASEIARSIADRSAAMLADATEVLGAPVAVALDRSGLDTREAIASEVGASAALVAATGRGRFAIVLSPAIARYVAERVVGSDAADVALGAVPLSRGELGLVGYVVARMLAVSQSDAALIDASSAREAIATLPGRHAILWSATITIGSVRGPAWLVTPIDLAHGRSSDATIDPSLPVRASIVIGAATLPIGEVRGLAIGDVLVPDSLTFDPRTLTGRARLVVGRSREIGIELANGGWCVADVAGLAAPTPARREKVSMSDATDARETLSDVDVELSIELARIEMSVGEVSSLAPGVVITSGRAIGERVAIRAGERVIAYGELVDVEGEIGVRLLEVAPRG